MLNSHCSSARTSEARIVDTFDQVEGDAHVATTDEVISRERYTFKVAASLAKTLFSLRSLLVSPHLPPNNDTINVEDDSQDRQWAA